MKNYDVFIGIDVSKLTLDICGIDNCNEVRIKHSVIKNSVNEIKSYFKKVIKNQTIQKTTCNI